jgi:tRNA pseudouridine55 synthase
MEFKNIVSGALIIDKPVGMTSHDVVQAVRRGTGLRRVGHTGTLDPRASGVLVVLLGPAVRLSQFISADDKRYQATLKLGTSTDTYDSEGRILQTAPYNHVTEEQFIALIKGYEGTTQQIPPVYSAVKVQGRPAYRRTRDGEQVELEPREINVYNLDLLEWSLPEVVLDVYCSSGTYVRSLAHDIGEDLGTGAHLIGLRRTKSGFFTLRHAVHLRQLQDAFLSGEWYRYLLPASELLQDWPMVELDNEQVEKITNGHRIPSEENPEMTMDGMARGISEQGDLVALLLFDETKQEWQPKKVFFQT